MFKHLRGWIKWQISPSAQFLALIPPFGFSISTRCGRNILVYPVTITANDSVSLRLSVFVWCIFSSAVIYMIAGLIAFTTLRRHKLGRFYSVMILIMGIMVPLSLGLSQLPNWQRFIRLDQERHSWTYPGLNWMIPVSSSSSNINL